MGDDPEGSDEPSKKRKRNRTTLSCTNCKQRKIKCSRQIPCENCIKRDVASTCRWADPAINPPQQVFALESVVESIRGNFESRLVQIERALQIAPGPSSAKVAKRALADAFAPSRDSSEAPQMRATAQPSTSQNPSSSPPSPIDHHAEAEDAAMALEVLATCEGICDDVKPSGIKLSLEDHAVRSLISKDGVGLVAHNNKLPMLGRPSQRAVVDSFLGYIRSRYASDTLLRHFFTSLSWSMGAVVERALEREHNAFWNLVASGERDFDPAWLANLCMLHALTLQLLPDIAPTLATEDFFDIGKAAMQLLDWRSKPSLRVVQFLFKSSIYVHNQGNLTAGRGYLAEATKAAEGLWLHRLGSDPSRMPPPDVAVPTGSLLARELGVRLWWDIVSHDWFAGSVDPHRVFDIRPDTFDTARPRNFSDDDLEHGDIDLAPQPASVVTNSVIYIAKSDTAEYVRNMYELGPVPPASELPDYYRKLLELDQRFVEGTAKWIGPSGAWLRDEGDWKTQLGTMVIHIHRLRIHRPLMVRGYSDPTYARSVKVCVECGQAVLDTMKRLCEMKAQQIPMWFVTRFVVMVVLALYMDVFHDADTGVPPEISDQKLVNLPAAVSILQSLDKVPYPQVAETSRKTLLLISALEKAKEMRRRQKRTGAPDNYATIFKRIANSVKETPTPTPTSTSSTPNDPASTVDWIDDAGTRQLLASLGMMDATQAAPWDMTPAVYTDGFASWPDLGSSNYGYPMGGVGMNPSFQFSHLDGRDPLMSARVL